MKREKRLATLLCRMVILVLTLTLLLPVSAEAATKKKPSKIKLNTASVTLMAGKTYQLKASGFSAAEKKKKRKWTSSNKNIATVSSKGLITTKNAGTATITLTVGKVKRKCKVTVFSVNEKQSLNIVSGKSKELSYRKTYFSEPGTWSVEDPEIGYMQNDRYYANHTGFNVVTYTNGGYTKTFTIKSVYWEAHRGYHAYHQENTLEAIKAAKDAGAISVELDVQLTKDGEFVLSHMNTLPSGAKLSGHIYNHTVAELTTLPILKKNGRYYRMPTMDEAIHYAHQLGLQVTIDIKCKGKYHDKVTQPFPDLPIRSCEESVEYLNQRLSLLLNPDDCITVNNDNLIGLFVKYNPENVTVRLPKYMSQDLAAFYAEAYDNIYLSVDWYYMVARGFRVCTDAMP